MSAVLLISNPTPDVTTFSWSPPGVTALTRENKLSSLPFWAPNDTSKRHQFRLVLLKGLVPATLEADDSLGLLVELIPPPDESPSAYPGGCIATVSLAARGEPAADGGATTLACTKKNMAVLDARNLQMSFPELVPARYTHDERYVSPENGALTFHIQLQTGANIVAEQVAAPLSSLWGAISSTLSSLVQQTERVVHDMRIDFAHTAGTDTAAAGSEGAVASETSHTPWSTVPKAWQDGREEAWRDLVRVRLGEDEGVALYGPERPMTLDEKNALVQVGVNPAVLLDLQNNFVYDRDVHEGLLESPTLNHMRYLLVPQRLKDETFWARYFWKVACLAQCVSDEQAHTVLTILNAPPAEAPRVVSHTVGSVTADDVASYVRDAEDSTALLLEYLADGPAADDALLLETAAETCRGHVKQLEPLFRRTDLSETQQQTIGSTLRGLRAALKQYDATTLAPAQAPACDSAPVLDPAPREDTTASLKEEVSVSATPPRTSHATEPLPSSTERQSREEEAGASPAPVTPQAHTSTTVAASPSNARSQSRISQIEFPKMPWEEEEDGDTL